MWQWHFVRAQEIARERQAEAAEWRRARDAARWQQLSSRTRAGIQPRVGTAAASTRAGA